MINSLYWSHRRCAYVEEEDYSLALMNGVRVLQNVRGEQGHHGLILEFESASAILALREGGTDHRCCWTLDLPVKVEREAISGSRRGKNMALHAPVPVIPGHSEGVVVDGIAAGGGLSGGLSWHWHFESEGDEYKSRGSG